MIKYKTNCNCNLNEFHNWNNTAGWYSSGDDQPKIGFGSIGGLHDIAVAVARHESLV